MKRAWILVALVALIGADLFAQQSSYDLRINSNVRGATIYVDGVRQRQTTPATVRVARGTREIRLSADGYADYVQSVSVTRNTSVNAIMQRAVNYSLSINGNVGGAEVFANGARIGVVGQSFSLSSGNYTIVIRAPGYLDYTIEVTLQSNQTVNAVLNPVLYSLRVNANSPECTVFINGQELGITNTSFQLAQGTYEVRVAKQGFQDYIETVTLTRNNTVVTAKMIPALATITIEFPGNFFSNILSPWLQLSILVDGEQLTIDGPTFQITPGEHQITIQSGILNISGTFNFIPGQTYVIRPSFQLILEQPSL